MALDEIVLPETKPETEWVRSRPLQKVSPTYSHAVLQRLLAAEIGDWADAGRFGRVGTEWRFRVRPPGEVTRPLVPDVAFLSFEALAASVPAERYESPRCAPTVAIEILLPRDRKRDLEDKIAVYLAAGSAVVIIVDPRLRAITVYDARVRIIRSGVLEHAALPGFSLDVAALFLRALGPAPDRFP